MKINEAIYLRLAELCKEKNLSWYQLSFETGVSYSTVKAVAGQKNKDMKIRTLQMLLDGLGITPRQFFDSALFDDLEQEME